MQEAAMMILVSDVKEADAQYVKTFAKVAHENRGVLHFLNNDIDRPLHSQISDMFGVTKKHLPLILVLDPED
jgi:hypothetical protein